MNDLKDWLENLGLGRYAAVFADNEIDHEVLADLTERDLKELDIPLGPRKKLLKAIAELSAGDSPEAAAAALRPTAGAPIPRPEAERRQLTVMFCDLVGSTALSVRFDPEDMSEIIRGYRDCCARIIERFQGNIARYLGDGLLVYFGYPQAREHAAEQAVQASLEIIKAVGELEPAAGLRLQTRIGIATGIVVVGDLIGATASERQSVIGETPNLAERLQTVAKPDSVVIAESTKRLTGGLFEYLDRGRHGLKGYVEPVQIWQVLDKRRVDSRFEAAHVTAELTPIVGREEEIELLQRCWRRARTGAGQVVLLSGEPGIGKSRIAQHVREQLAAEPHTLMRYYCSPYYQNSALFPVIDQLERAAQFARGDTAEAKLDRLEALLARAVDNVPAVAPLFAALLSIPSSDRYRPLKLSPQRQKQETLAALLARIVGLAERQPVLLIFEDLHWIDPTTLELLDRFVDRVQTLPVLGVMTFRPDFSAPWIGYPQVATLSLNRLSDSGVSEVIAKLTRSKPLPATVQAQIVAKTDGIPLFVEELTKTVLEAGFLRDEGDRYTLDGSLPPLAVPSTLQDSLMARLDRLSLVKEVIQIGAVIGRQFSYELLAALTPLKDQALAVALDRLTEAKLVFRRGAPPEATYTFKHALVQDAAYSSLLRSKRRDLHARITQALEERFPNIMETEPELLAHHYTLAGLNQEAIDCWLKASQRAIQRSAYREAVAHLDKGLELLEQLPAGSQRERRELRLQTARATVYQITKGWAAAETGEAYSRARELCAQIDEISDVFPVLHGIYLFHMLRAEIALAHEVAGECLRRAQQQDDSLFLTIGHRLMGACLFVSGKFVAARDHFSKALALYDPEQHKSAVLSYGVDQKTIGLAHFAQVLFALGYLDQALEAAENAVLHAERLGHGYNLGYALQWYCVLGLQRRAPDSACRRAQQLAELGREQGLPNWAALGEYQHGAALVQLGDLDRGIAQMERGLQDYLALGSEVFRPIYFAPLALAFAEKGQTAKALNILTEALATIERTQERWFEAELHRLKGELLLLQGGASAGGEAEACFHRSLSVARAQSAKLWELRAVKSLTSLWREQGKREKACDLLAQVYDGFREGFDSADLAQARKLLDELSLA